MKVAILLLALIALCGAQTTIKMMRSQQISTTFNYPIAVEFYFPTNNIIVSAWYYSGYPYNFQKIDSYGNQYQWSTVAGESDEIMMSVVRQGNTAGFIAGDIFTGNGQDGQVQRITNGGNTVYTNWCQAPLGGVGLLRGAVHVDLWNNGWGHQLYICTTNGWFFKMTYGVSTCGTATTIGSSGGVGTHLEGMATIPNDPRYGLISNSVLGGAENNGRLYYVLATALTTTSYFSIGCNIEDIDLVLPNQNYFFISYGSGRLLSFDYTQWLPHWNKIILAEEVGGPSTWELITPASTAPYCSLITYDNSVPASDRVGSGSFEQAVFAPAGIAQVLPATFSLCLNLLFGGTTVTSGINDYNTIKLTTTNTGYTNYNYNGVNSGNPIIPATSYLSRGNMYLWFAQDYVNQFTLSVFIYPSGPGSITLNLASSAAGSSAYYILQNDASDSYYFVSSTGTGRFTFTWSSATITKGVVISPIDFLDATSLFTATWTVTSLTGTGLTGWSFVGMPDASRTGSSIPKFWPSTPHSLGTSSPNNVLQINRVPCNCSDGTVEQFEQCDNGAQNGQLGQCCTTSCTFMAVGTVCNPNSGQPCDLADSCSGSSGTCADTIITDGRQCSAQTVSGVNLCGYCDGVHKTCGTPVPSCPTCASLNNCSGHGACLIVSGVTQCNCDSSPESAYTGPTCNVPSCGNLTTCGTCALHPQCGWCCKEQVCVSGTPTAPDAQYNASCDINFYRGSSSQCFCNGTRACQNGGTCDVCGDCQCVPPYGGATCSQALDCLGVLGGNATNDLCGCNKGNTSCIGCDNIPFGKVYDNCGVCGGDGTSCYSICSYTNCQDCSGAESCGWCKHKGDSSSDGCVNTAKDTSSCDALITDQNNCGLLLSTSAIVGITGGILALIIIIVIVVVAAVVAGGSYAGYKYWSKYRGKFGAANSNPMYVESKMGGTNPLFEAKD